MRKHLIITLSILIFLLTACTKKLEYECNLTDQAFIPFFGDEEYSFNGINIGSLNQCNDELDEVDTSNQMINTLYRRVDEKNLSIEPDISGIESYIDYYSNSRKYLDDLVSYNIFDTLNGTMELAFIYDTYLQIDLFVEYYKDPIEGDINDFELTNDFYKMQFYVNDDFLYFVQYHNEDGSQFTVTRIYFTPEDKMIYDNLTYYKEGKSYNYEYTYYQEGVKGVKAQYKEFDEKKGLLDIREANFSTGYIYEYHISNYINPMYKLHIIDPTSKTIIDYTQETNKYMLNKEIYDSNGFVYAERYDDYEEVQYDYRFNITHLTNWDYYFQNSLYLDESSLIDSNGEVFVNTKIKLDGFIDISQHFEYIYHSDKETYQLPNNLNFNGLTQVQQNVLNEISKESIDSYFIEILSSQDVKEIELLNIWKTYVPSELSEFIEENK